MKIQAFSKYESYKDSRIARLGEIPSHWELKRKKYLFSERVQKGFPDEPLLAATQSQGVVRKTDYDARTVEATKDFHLLKLVKQGDFVISLRSFEGGIEFAHYQGIISPAYTVLTPYPGVEAGFYRYFLKSPQFIQSLKLFVTGIREGQNIDYTKLSRAFLPCPPASEAKRIANFLDQKTAEIDEAIAKKQRLIELLKEQKAILINQAVTKGLNPDVPMRDSGVAWIGKFPSHWAVKKFKYCCRVTSGQVDPRKEPFASMPLIAPNHIESSTGRLIEIQTAKEQGADSGKYQLLAGDIVYSKIRPALKKNCISPVDGLCSADIYVLRPFPILDSEYFIHFILTDAFTIPAIDAAMRVAMPKVNREALGCFPILLPPIHEQREIAASIKKINEQINTVQLSISNEIYLLHEFSQVLVSEAVTGKIKI